MSSAHPPRLADIVAAYKASKSAEELRGEWGAVLLYRPLSFLLTPPLIRLGLGATTVTAISCLLALALPFVALGLGPIWLALAGFVFSVLDCVDGNIARATGTTSRRGQYADFVTDVIYRAAMYLSIGLLLAPGAVAGWWPLGGGPGLGLAAALLALAARLSRVYVEHAMGADNPYQAPLEVSLEGPAPGPLARLAALAFPVLSDIDPLLPVLVLAAGLLGGLEWVLIWLLAYSALDFLYSQVEILRGLE